MQDLRLAVRTLRATPVVTAVAILSLALGIGANTAVFSLLDHVALQSLPIADPDRLVRLSGVNAPEEGGPYSYALYDQLRRRGDLFDGIGAYNCCGLSTLTIGKETHEINRMWVTGDFFSTLGVPAAAGRMIRRDDDRASGGREGFVAVISDQLWRERFGASGNAIGAAVVIERAPVTIVGVMPPGFLGLEVGRTVDVALPVRTLTAVEPTFPFDDDSAFLAVLGRLRHDRTLAATIAALHAVQPDIRDAAQPKGGDAPEWLKAPLTLVRAGRGTSTLRQHFEQPLVVLLAVVALVLLIACANLANLLLARGLARRAEFAIRAALGASGSQLVRPLLSESFVLVAAGTACGLLFARWATHAMTAALSTPTGRIVFDQRLDWRLLAFTSGMTVLTVLLFGMVPGMRAARVDPIDGLKAQGRGVSTDGRRGLSTGLLVGQTAVSLVLVVAAALLVETFRGLVRAPLGFDRDHTLMVTVTAPTVPMAERQTLFHRMVKVAAEVPGVAGAGGSLNPPLIGMLIGDFVVSEPGTQPAPSAEPISRGDTVTPGWFGAEGMTVLDGRDFDDHDTLRSEQVSIVNEAFVQRILGGRRDAVGTRLALTLRLPIVGDVPWNTRRIVGVVNDSVYRSVRDTPKPAMYSPLAQFDAPLRYTNFFIVVRSRTGRAQSLRHELSAALTGLHDDVRLRFQTVAEQVDEAVAQDRLVAAIAVFVGVLAVLLAAIGLYGVTAYNVERQRSEIGIRLALGAQPNHVLRLVLSRVVGVVGAGILIGAVVSAWASKFVASLLYSVEPRDPITFVSAAIILAAVGALAGWLPAWRASRTDPAAVLRAE
jgi:predicted permease